MLIGSVPSTTSFGTSRNLFSKSLYNIDLIAIRLYVPPDSCTNKDFLREVLSGQKKLLKLSEVKWINTPKYDEISVVNLYPKFKTDANITVYLPSNLPAGKLPDRTYFFNILNTIYEERLSAMIAHANKVRFQASADGIQEETVAVTDEWWQKLNEMPFFSCKCILSLMQML